MVNTKLKRFQVIGAITAPLGFFVLALLIVESFLAIILIYATLENADRVYGMYIGVGLFVYITFIVSLFVWFKPDNLIFDKEARLIDSGKADFGTDSHTAKNQDLLKLSEPREQQS